MLELLPVQSIYRDRPFFNDFVCGRGEALTFLENASRSDPFVPEQVPRAVGEDGFRSALHRHNLDLGAGAATLANIEALASPRTLCVLTGQQPGILGGPLYTAYKIMTAIRTARQLADRLAVRAVPIYWLASQDHDINEVNQLQWLDKRGAVTTARFRWHQEGRRFDALPITDDALEIMTRYFDDVAGGDDTSDRIRSVFAPAAEDSFCSWHARIWLRLFTVHGLVIADPCTLPPPTSFYRTALREHQEIRDRVSQQCLRLQAAGYPSPFPSGSAGGLFAQDDHGKRVRVADPDQSARDLADHPLDFSPDAALRPVLADRWFPTAVNILGPGEISYHAALGTLYPMFGLQQPPAAFRLSLSVLSAADRALIQDVGVSIEEAVSRGLRARDAGWHFAPNSLREVWQSMRETIQESLDTVGAEARRIDPGLERPVGTARGGVSHALERLEQRILRAILAKRGVSPARLSALTTLLAPKDRPQERILSLPELLVRHGAWLTDRMLELEPWPIDCHAVMTVDEPS